MKYLVLEFSPEDGFLANWRMVKSEPEMLQLVATTAASLCQSVRVHASRDEKGIESVEVSKSENETQTVVVAKRIDGSSIMAMVWATKLAKESNTQMLESALELQIYELGVLAQENVSLMKMH